MDDFSERKSGSLVPPHPDEAGGGTARGTRRNDLFFELTLVYLAVAVIEAAPRRVRRAMKSQTEAVKHSIERFGFRVPILVRSKSDRDEYEVVDGLSRLEAARQLAAERVPCILVDDLPEIEIRRLTLSLNKLAETGAWDEDALKLEIDEIISIDGDFEFPGFEFAEIEGLHFGIADPGTADLADDTTHLALTKDPVTAPGDVWQLGEHVLVCGSARDKDALASALDGQTADCIFTDAPYNLKVNGVIRCASNGFAEFREASGEMSRAKFVAFLTDTLGNAVVCLKPGGVIFSCIDHRHIGEMLEAIEALELERLDICVWVKSAPGMGGLYRSQHELVVVARRSGARHRNNVLLGKNHRNRSNVWSYSGGTGGPRDADDDFDCHPTPKPIRLVMDALLDATEPGDLVLDPFLGSGTTLLAAERTRRRCVGVEIEPRYVDLTIRRWQEMTGGKAIHAETKEYFDEMSTGDDQTTPPRPKTDCKDDH